MNDQPKQLLQKILKENEYSVTKARLAVFDLMVDREPQSMHELITNAQGMLDRVSVYRTIQLFEDLGIVQRIIIGWKYKLELTDIFMHHHHHISCLKCGKMMPIKEDAQIERLISDLASAYDIQPERHQLEIQGYCKNCLKIK